MSHDGNKNYKEREYEAETIIKIDDYVDLNNKIEDSFIQEKIDNSRLYGKIISKKDFQTFLENRFIT